MLTQPPENSNRFSLIETNDGSKTVYDHLYAQCYKSPHAAKTESNAIYWQEGVVNNTRLRDNSKLRILELGFGLGQNFSVLTENIHQYPHIQFDYVGIDRTLEPARFFAAELNNTSQLLIQNRQISLPGLDAHVIVGEFYETVKELPSFSFDAIFYDPFSPKVNRESWNPKIVKNCQRILQPNGRLVTYSVSRIAKNGMLEAGFQIRKFRLPKELYKRSGLIAIKPKEEI